jgi:hypothetical protein
MLPSILHSASWQACMLQHVLNIRRPLATLPCAAEAANGPRDGSQMSNVQHQTASGNILRLPSLAEHVSYSCLAQPAKRLVLSILP